MDYMYNACSTTARRGALDWAPIFEKANAPVFEALYKSVKDGTETRKSLEFNGRSTYRQDLAKELKEIDDQEIWRAGKYPYFSPYRGIDVDGVRCHRQDCTFSPPRLQARVDQWSYCGCWIRLVCAFTLSDRNIYKSTIYRAPLLD